jgi:hypothetical protein
MKRKPPCPAAEGAPYEVGYGKPPKHSQFKPGQSGHRSGRPRGQLNFKTSVKEALKEKITIREGEKTRTISKLDAIIQVTFNKALKGDVRALVAFLQVVRCAGLLEEQSELSSAQVTSAEDEAILERYLEHHGLKPVEERARPAEQRTSPPRQKKKNTEDQA